jgi:TNF receptor-associated factor 2
MCLRLYLNGDGDTRDTHLSLFFVLLRGDYDAILKWPFPYKVTFYLIDHSTVNASQCHITDSFWPDLSLNCFQRPDSSMNNAYGIKTFYSLEQLEKYGHLYTRDDVMFIKAEIAFLSERPGKIMSCD